MKGEKQKVKEEIIIKTQRKKISREMKNFRKSWKAKKFNFRIVKEANNRGDSDKEEKSTHK